MPTEFTTHTDSPLEVILAAHLNDIQDAINGLEAGWTPAPETWTYASATTFTVSGDYTAYYVTGTRIRMTNSTVKYFVVVSSAHSAGTTTVTITGGSDYSLVDLAITLPYYSYSPSPPNYPPMFNYTPTGVSAAGVTLSGRFSVLGRRCLVDLLMEFTGAITFTTMPTLPITASANMSTGSAQNHSPCGTLGYLNSGTTQVMNSYLPCVIASDTTVGIFSAAAGASMSATAPITWANNDILNAHFSYEI